MAIEIEEINTGKVRKEVATAMAVTDARRLAEREIEQVHVLSKWTLGIISALLLLGASWLWQISNSINVIERNLDRYATAFQAQEPTLIHLRNHADKAELDIQRLTQDLVQVERRTGVLEGSASQGARYTARDGEMERDARIQANQVLGERIAIIEKRLSKIEDDKIKHTK